MADFELPEDITQLSADELDGVLDGAVQAFDTLSKGDTLAPEDLAQLRALATAVDSIRQEKAARVEAAQQAADEIDALAAQVRGDKPNAEPEPEPEA
ncbi:cell wall protein, partial [Streptomyces sp. SID11233]|nr:cell wall protein [Streptomyces sp. SID11233]